MKLRPFQSKLVADIRQAFANGARRVLAVAPTGSGKTTVAAEILRMAVAKGNRALFLAGLDAIVEDTHARLVAAELRAGFVQAGRPVDPEAPIQVCSLDTLHTRGFYPPADFIFLDEAHGACAATVRTTLEQYPHARLLGGTATPQRGDGQPLGDIFEAMVVGPSVAELTALGFLVPAVVYAPPAPTEGTLAREPAEALDTFAPGRPAMIFCRDAEHAREVAGRIGERAVVILGDTSRASRREARERLAAGEPLVLVGCGVFVEGWDSPQVEAVVLARTFGVCGSYLQACGRALRPAPGKREATIVDLVGASIFHGTPADQRIWSLDGTAVQRTGEALRPLARCTRCFAIFTSGPSSCPRCGTSTRGARLPRRATRVERAELARLDERPQWERDDRALRAIEMRLRRSGRFAPHVVSKVALSIFTRTNKRPPAAKPEQAA